MKNFRPLVSIAVITYNHKDFLQQCIESCLAQNYTNLEIVVADDCSSDGSQDLLRTYQRKSPININVHLSSKNAGIAANCNRAWKACSGEWIKTIAGDDRLDPNCIKKFIENIIEDDGKVDGYFSFMKCEETGVEISCDKSFFGKTKEGKIAMLCDENNSILSPTSFLKKSILNRIGYADLRFPMLEDYPLWLSLVRHDAQIKLIDDQTVFYRRSSGISSNNKPGHLKYLRSVFDFQRCVLWREYRGLQRLKIIDDLSDFFFNITVAYFGWNKHKKIWLMLLPKIFKPYSAIRFAQKKYMQ